MNCKICGNHASVAFGARVLFKYQVKYFRCGTCGFMQTETPYWLEEAYNSAIARLDIGLLSRNATIQPILATLITGFFRSQGKFLDYGGGYGVLVRQMRDIGYDFYRQDIYCENMFAKGFDIEDITAQRFELLTAFEVFEHLVNPLDELEQMLEHSDSIFFSTELVPAANANPNPQNWWYFVPETGQHIAFYTENALARVAKLFGLNFYTNQRNLHLLTKRKVNAKLFRVATNYRAARLWQLLQSNPKSLLPSDFEKLRQQVNQR